MEVRMFIYKRNNGVYYFQFKDENGQWKKVSTGSKTKSEALMFLRTYKQKTIEQKIVVPTISEFSKEYLVYVEAAMSANSFRNIKSVIKFLLTQFGDVQLTEVDSIRLEKSLLVYYTKSKHGAFYVYRTLKSAFNKAKRWKYLKLNPFDEFRLPKIPKKLPVFINEEEFNLIAHNITRKRIYQISVTAFYTGMRLSEVLHFTWEQVDLENRMINLNNSESFITKSKKPRNIPMCQKVYDILKALSVAYKPGYDIKENIVFYKFYGIPYSTSYVSHYFKAALNKTGLRKGIKFHTLRHSFASMLVSKGVSLYVVKELLGHSDFATTQIYAHLESKSLKDAIDRLNN